MPTISFTTFTKALFYKDTRIWLHGAATFQPSPFDHAVQPHQGSAAAATTHAYNLLLSHHRDQDHKTEQSAYQPTIAITVARISYGGDPPEQP